MSDLGDRGGDGGGPGGDSSETLFTRDGHLTELTASRRAAGELSGQPLLLVEAHLASCAACRERDAIDRAFDAQLQLPPLQLPSQQLPPQHEIKKQHFSEMLQPTASNDTSAPGGRLVPAIALGTALAMAASVALWLRGQPSPTQLARLDLPEVSVPAPGLRPKSGAVTLEIFVHDGSRVRRAEASEPVAPGERLAFRASSAAGGQLVIAGIDSSGEPYLCYPQATEGASMALAPKAQSHDLGEAIELDDKHGRERIVAVLCPEPFHYRQLAAALPQRHAEAGDGPLARLLEGCSQHEITLQKESRKDTP